MFHRLEEVQKRFEQIEQSLMEPGVASDQDRYRKLMKEMAGLEPIVRLYRELRKVQFERQSNLELLETEKDSELRELAKEELTGLVEKEAMLTEQLKLELLPKDPNDEKNVILEIRAGAGGDEASLFAQELFRAYSHYAANRGWRVELISISEGNVGGYKEVIAMVSGEKVYSLMKYESGVHRVQRVPQTEASGRVHTSTITVAVIPETEVTEIKINQNDLRIDVMRASGSGGQSVNRTESAVRVTHLPTGLVVVCQEGKSQHSNKDRAMQVLYSRLKALEDEKQMKEASDARLSQIGTGDRSERIRTYNFPQSRITDHRIGLTVHNIHEVMNGEFGPIQESLVAYYQAEALKQQTAS